MVRVKLSEVTKTFGRVVAVNRVSLEIPESSFYVLLGPSGSGKTTLLYLIAGIYKPTSGRILFGDRDVTSLPPSERNVGLVFQNYALYPHMTVYENIAFPLRLRKVPKSTIDVKVYEAAKLLRIEELLDRYPSQLSGGQQQRVALARALVKEPSVLLLDEPLSNLDALLRIHIRSELKRLQKELEITTIYVTHDQSEAMALADKVVVLNSGVIQQIGTPSEVYDNPRNVFVTSFIGNPPANIVEGEVGEDGCIRVLGSSFCPGDEIVAKLKKLGLDKIVVAFRPEYLRVQGQPSPGSLAFEAEVYTIEPLGRETVVTLQSRDGMVKAVVQGGTTGLTPGEETIAYVEPAYIKLFDPETGLNIDYVDG